MAEIFDSLAKRLDALTLADFEGHETKRLQLLSSARKLLSRVELNQERVMNIAFSQPITYAALKTCVDLGLWHGWTEAGGGEKSVDELVKLTSKDCDLNLLRRFLHLLGAANIIEETGEDRYRPTNFSFSIGDKSTRMAEAVNSKADHWDISQINLPKFLAKTSYREPVDPKHSSYSDGNPEGLSFFDRCLSKQYLQDSFSGFMTEWAKYKIPWPQYYDTETLVKGADLSSGDPLVVDIGGHHGIDLSVFLDKHPDVPAGSLVLQDLPGVLSGANITTDKIRPMAHNFFEVQPVHGSRAYFFHAVFHDWPDTVAVQMLRNLVPALKKGYSKVLICDIVIPRTGASIYQTGMDVNMMAELSGLERTEDGWMKLLKGAGLDFVKMWKDLRGYETVIEAELA
ncbi:hypothetical protein M426DRAFT_238377 [Hypoxylon sp. CI-4A]|nr:hypothetical protein M426DRAFT_238377 [Hypoxylon sp. CI-4A]